MTPREASKMLRRRCGVQKRGLRLSTVQGGGGGRRPQTGWGHFQPAGQLLRRARGDAHGDATPRLMSESAHVLILGAACSLQTALCRGWSTGAPRN